MGGNTQNTDATNQSYGQKGSALERRRRRRRTDVSLIREYGFLEDGLQVEDAAQKSRRRIEGSQRRTSSRKAREAARKREEGDSEEEREVGIRDSRVNKTACGTSTAGVPSTLETRARLD